MNTYTGLYQHFKGEHYYVMAVAKHSENDEKLVIYRNAAGEVFARPFEMFFDNVERDGYKGSRFNLIMKTNCTQLSISELIQLNKWTKE